VKLENSILTLSLSTPSPLGAILLSAAAAFGGCVGELYHVSVWKGIDDNFSVPVMAALTALLMANGAGFISILPRLFS
jgi:dolichol kinase